MEELIKNLLIASIGIVLSWKLFLWQFWQIFRDESNLKKAKNELPILAKEFKLNHKKGDDFGSYLGHWNKHKIRIEPNNYKTSIGIKTMGDPQFSALHEGISEKQPFDLIYLFSLLTRVIIKFIPDYPVVESEHPIFDFGDPLLDKYFNDRQILSEKGKDNTHDSGLQKAIKDFLKKNRKIVKNLSIGAEVSCSLWLGSSSTKTRTYSVTDQQVKHMLTEMFPIVKELERALKY